MLVKGSSGKFHKQAFCEHSIHVSDAEWMHPSACSWWRHQMETFSALLALCAGNSPVTGEFPHKGQWRGALMFTLICVWINYWAKNREAGDLRRHRAHYGVTVMLQWHTLKFQQGTTYLGWILDSYHPNGGVDQGVRSVKKYCDYWGKLHGWFSDLFF